MRNIILGLLIGAGIVLALWAVAPTGTVPIGGAIYNQFSSVSVSTVSVPTTTAVAVLSASSGRKYARIDNEDATNPVYCVFGATSTAAVSKGAKIEAGEYLEIDAEKLYVGDVSCIASGGVVTVGVMVK